MNPAVVADMMVACRIVILQPFTYPVIIRIHFHGSVIKKSIGIHAARSTVPPANAWTENILINPILLPVKIRIKITETAAVINGIVTVLKNNMPARIKILSLITVRLAETKKAVDIRRNKTGVFISLSDKLLP